MRLLERLIFQFQDVSRVTRRQLQFEWIELVQIVFVSENQSSKFQILVISGQVVGDRCFRVFASITQQD